MTPDDFKSLFIQKASKFSSAPPILQTEKKKTKSYLTDAIYGPEDNTESSTIENEIRQYLGEPREPRNKTILDYWKLREEALPGLAQMAKMYLAIPATSTPSEGAFSKTKRIIVPQRSSLSSKSVEILLCLKEWYRVFGALSFPSSINSSNAPIEIDEED